MWGTGLVDQNHDVISGGRHHDCVESMNWKAAQAACRASQPDKRFVRGAEQNKAKQVCGACPVRTECLAEALDNQIEWGVWGGMTERERRALLRRRPNVTSWSVAPRVGPRRSTSSVARLNA